MADRALAHAFIRIVKKTFSIPERFFVTTPYAAIPFSERYYGKRYNFFGSIKAVNGYAYPPFQKRT
jgi:hypothetical protein